jgi:hypothetical protein
MRYCKRPDYRSLGLRAILCLMTALVLLPAARGAEPGIVIDDGSVRLQNGIYVIDAHVEYTLNKELLRALDAGVPLTFDVEAEFTHERKYLWDSTVATVVQRLRLEYHALSKQFLVSNLSTQTQQSFPTLEDALRKLGEIQGMAIIEKRFLEPAKSYKAKIHVALEIEALPAPMRPLAYLSLDWRFRSNWYKWAFVP